MTARACRPLLGMKASSENLGCPNGPPIAELVATQTVLKNATTPRTQPVTVIENISPATARSIKIDPRDPLNIDAQGQLLVIWSASAISGPQQLLQILLVAPRSVDRLSSTCSDSRFSLSTLILLLFDHYSFNSRDGSEPRRDTVNRQPWITQWE